MIGSDENFIPVWCNGETPDVFKNLYWSDYSKTAILRPL